VGRISPLLLLIRRVALATGLVGAYLVLTPGVAAAQGTPPPNDSMSGATPLTYTPASWTGLVAGPANPTVIPTTTWGPATTGLDDAAPPGPPSCVGSVGYRSLWYSVNIPSGQAADIRITVQSDDPSRYQPVVTIIDPVAQRELACGLESVNGTSTTMASATAYVTGASPAGSTYYIRVAEVDDNGPQGAGPELVLNAYGLDHTPPAISIKAPASITGPKQQQLTFDPGGTTDGLSGVDWTTAHWHFHDGKFSSDQGPDANAGSDFQGTHKFHSPGYHRVDFWVSDKAGNVAEYTFLVYIHDFVPPQVARFGVRSIPFPRARHMTIILQHNEGVNASVTVVQNGHLLYNGTLRMLGSRTTRRGIRFRRPVARFGLLTMSGVARDFAGNSTLLPVCELSPFSGRGVCHSLVPKTKR
jgi:hypothetical protein